MDPKGLIAEQCISIRSVDENKEARQVEIMRITPTLIVDDFGIRYSRKSFGQTTVRGPEAWELRHRHDEEALSYLPNAA